MQDKKIIPIQEADRPWLRQLFTEHWGGPVIVTRGQVFHVDDLPGFIVQGPDNLPLGVATYHLDTGRQVSECELTSLDSLVEGQGIGSALIKAVQQVAIEASCARLFLITTNDNLHALRFYQRRGFRLVAVHAGAMAQTRRLKPIVPEIGLNGIPLRDEIELEIPLLSSLPQPFADRLGIGAGTRLSRRPIYESRWVNLYIDHVLLPSGLEIADFHLIDFPTEAVAAYITNNHGEVLLGQYYRYTIGQLRWEVPAGGIEPGEDICAAAQREVMEETGYSSYDYTKYYSFHPTAGSTNKHFHLARGFAGERTGSHDPNELAGVAWFSIPRLRQLIRQGELTDGYTLTALLIAWELGL